VDDREELLTRMRAEQVRRAEALDAIRSHLQEQPSSQSISACARRWCSEVMNLAGEITKGRPC
jgi:hypothetical protein